jgi:hypothetical protein
MRGSNNNFFIVVLYWFYRLVDPGYAGAGQVRHPGVLPGLLPAQRDYFSAALKNVSSFPNGIRPVRS